MMAGTIFMVLGVILGAMGAHALEKSLTPAALDSFETAVRYQIYHGLALLILARYKSFNKTILYLFIGGVILFSGSIYLLTTDELMSVSLSALGPVTPIGGMLLIIGWIVLFINILREKSANRG
ncbi:DUF423 domain-containing protein [Phaeocystidibacter luteus]|uniref:DUF423 domain-containing protein n=2 Tax=Phaeocystidibacter luteus TaxID=911197 RepID=A0A6N6RMS5_9FLAO|nr:DUF423 domain-containing protein [Phaeocystidibacter luteus]